MQRWIPAIAAIAVLAVVVIFGAVGGGSDGTTSAGLDTGPVDNANYVVTDLTVPASGADGVVTEAAPVPVVKTSLGRTLVYGMTGDDVRAVQTRLTELGFAPGDADGSFGGQTQQAVWAFEKLILNTPRAQATGKVTDAMWQRMQDPLVVAPLRPDAGTHVEIYLPQQVAAVFTDNRATLVIHIASGTGQEWCDTVLLDTDASGAKLDPPVEKAVCGISKTPGGVFKFDREITGKRNGPLGGMDNPIYFNYGIAMHGAQSVPLEPASHGCIRMHKKISESFQSYVSLGDRVYVWGEDGKQPEQYTHQESLPIFNYPDKNATTTTTSTTTTTTTVVTAPSTVESESPTVPATVVEPATVVPSSSAETPSTVTIP
jgi:hypothetical protein